MPVRRLARIAALAAFTLPTALLAQSAMPVGKIDMSKLRAPPISTPVTRMPFNANLVYMPAGPQVELTITINGKGRVRGPGFNCLTSGDQTNTICTKQVAEGWPILVEAIGKSGNVLTGWAGACGGSTVKCAITPKGKTQLAATFGPPPVQQMTSIKVAIPEGAGSVKAGSLGPNAIDCAKASGTDAAGTCAIKVPLGSTISLIAEPGGGSAFNGWESDQPGCSAFECSFTAQDPIVLTARFGSKTTTSKLTLIYQRTAFTGIGITSDPSIKFDCTPKEPPSYNQAFVSTCVADLPTGSAANLAGQWNFAAPGGGGYGPKMTDEAWGGECQSKSGGICTVAMTKDRTVLASWPK